ncbi:OstA-like protein [Psychroflexus sp. CAK57W]|uniref:OstA-like protein n=1 Tax=Psychroflexus curvus TaxID=2873595 RepID=UPI001CCD31E9|nr:OstA-like protein [Psychroflexus curvus]MBZ9627562.1 OstA-like protein [Psychroflexus curvus]MBZ9786049.1 OstA-like protein [Psychroflexus curvus]
MKYLIVRLSFFLLSSFLYAQEGKEVQFTSDRSRVDQENYPDAFILSKVQNQVYFIHEGIEVWCDRAIFYQTDDFFKAYGNVRMKQGDTVNMTSKYAEYNGTTQFAFASEDVVLTTPSNKLTTDSLFFNRINQEAFYRSGGTVKDSASTITSEIGRYFMDQEKLSFRQNVKVRNPEYNIDSDYLDFYSEKGHAYLYGPSTITSETSVVYCERGFYDTRNDNGFFVKNSKIDYENRKLEGDSIFFDRPSGFASASNNIKVTDTINQSVITGHYAELFRKKDSLFIAKNPLVAMKQQNDSVFIASDTLMVTGEVDQRQLSAFYDARIFKSDLSGKADSIHSSERTGITKLIREPVLWSGESQITGDTIFLISNTETEELDSLKVFYNAFMIKKDSIEGFNQIKGKELYGLLKNNEIYQVNVIKNTESLFYLRDETTDLMGINKSLSARIKIVLEDQEIVDLYYYTNVDSDTYPSSVFPENEKKLKGFNWRGEERLTAKSDLFKGRDSLVLPKIQGIKEPEIYDDFFEGMRDLNLNSTLKESSLKSTTEAAEPEEKENKKPKAPQKLQKLKAIPPADEQ